MSDGRAEASLAEDFKFHDGPFVMTLDSEFNEHRLAYHSLSFVGNHVHRTLNVK